MLFISGLTLMITLHLKHRSVDSRTLDLEENCKCKMFKKLEYTLYLCILLSAVQAVLVTKFMFSFRGEDGINQYLETKTVTLAVPKKRLF